MADGEFFSQQPGYVWTETGEGGFWSYNPAQAAAQKEAAVQNQPWFYKPQTSEEELRRLATQSPYTVSRVVEGGEGQRTEYTTYDPASQANLLLAQPAQVSADYIRTNYPSLAGLPANVLNQMGSDWRTAYAHLQKMPEQSASGWSGGREGIVPLPVRIEGGQPFLSTGGGGELFTEALPYVTYSPEYGLAAPKEAMRPYQEKFGIMNLVPGVFGAAMLGPLGTALGSTVGAGALIGGGLSALQGGDIAKGALMGAATPLIGGAVSSVAGDLTKSLAGVIGADAAKVVANAATGAARSAISGGDPMQGALAGAAGAAAGTAVSGMDFLKDLDPSIAKAITAAASGAASAAATGGDPMAAALNSAVNTAARAITSGPTTPEQAGSAVKEPGIGDWLSQKAEDVMSFFVPEAQAAGQDRLEIAQPETAEGAQQADYRSFFDLMSQSDPEAKYAGLSPDEREAVDRAGQEFQASSDERKMDLMGAYKSGQFTPAVSTDDILEQLDRQAAEQQGMASALEGAYQPTLDDILSSLRGQEAQAAEMKTALAPQVQEQATADVDKRIEQLLKQGEDERTAMEQALREQFGAQTSSLEQSILSRMQEGESRQQATADALKQQFGTGLEGITERLTEQEQQQAAMEAALRGEYQTGFSSIQEQLAAQEAERKAQQAALEAQFGTKLGGVESSILDRLGASEAERVAAEEALRKEFGLGFGDITTQLQKQAAEQEAMEAALRGEYQAGFGSLEERLSAASAEQAAQQAAMQEALQAQFGAGLSDIEKQILAQAQADEADRAAMEAALQNLGTSTTQQIGQVQAGLGRQIGALGGQLAQTQQQQAAQQNQLQQQVQSAQQQAGFGNLLAMLGLAQQQKSEQEKETPVPVVGKITPYEFSTNLLEGIYKPRMAQGGSVDELIKILRG